MEERAAGDVAQQAFIDVHGSRDGDGERGDALAMAFGLGVFGVERAAERFERVVVGLFEILQRDGELLGAFGDELLEIALVGAIFDDQAAMFQRAADAEVQLIFFEGLQDVVVGAGTNGFESDGNIVHRCDHDHRNVGILIAKLGEQLEAVHFRHDDIAEDEVESIFAESVQGEAAIRADGAGVTLRFQKCGNYFANCFFVVDYEDFFGFHDKLPENG